MKYFRLLVAVGLIAGWALPVAAEDGAVEKLRRLEERVTQLEAENTKLKKDQDALSEEVDAYLAETESYEGTQGGSSNAGYDDGFYIRGGNGFVLKINYGIQVRIKAFHKDQDSANPRSQTGFEIARSRIWFSGSAWSDITYMLEVDAGNATFSGSPGVLDVWIAYKINNSWKVTAGQFKPGLFHQERVHWAEQQFVDRSIIGEFFNRDRAVGVSLHGMMSDNRLSIQFGVFNTFGTFGANGNSGANLPFETGDVDNQFAYSLKIDFAIKGDMADAWVEGDRANHANPLLVVGLSFGYENNNNPATVGVDQYIFGFDATFKTRGLSVQGEWFSLFLEPDAGTGTAFHGFYVQAGYFIKARRFEVVARFGWMKADDNMTFTEIFDTPSTFFILSSDDTFEFAIGFNWYPNDAAGSHLKVSVDATYVEFVRRGSAFANINVGDRSILIRGQIQFFF